MLVVTAAGTAFARVLQSLEAYKRTTDTSCGRPRSLLKAVSHWEVVLQVPSGLFAPTLKPGFFLSRVSCGLVRCLSFSSAFLFLCLSLSASLESFLLTFVVGCYALCGRCQSGDGGEETHCRRCGLVYTLASRMKLWGDMSIVRVR